MLLLFSIYFSFSVPSMNMAAVQYAAFLAIILVHQSYSATANFTFPFLPPLFGDNPCRPDVCGRGKCVASNRSTSGYECECDEGWRQTRFRDDQFFTFLPCIVPNCSLNFNCAQAPPPVADRHMRPNFSFFDPCSWTDCGGGSCNRTSIVSHACLCDEGYYNLMNSTSFPCYKECALGADCATLGFNMFNSSAPRPHPTSTVVDDRDSHSQSLIPRVEFSWLITMATTLALVASKYG